MNNPVLKDEYMVRVDTIVYILKKLKEMGESSVDSLKVGKLIVLADIYKLRLDGRTITMDRYVALKNGPVASDTANIISFSENYVNGGSKVLDYADKYIDRSNRDLKLKEEPPFDYLSEFDKECIDYVLTNYGKLTAKELIDGNNGENVHAFNAWKKHNITEYGEGQSASIDLTDFFENDGPVKVPKEKLAIAKEDYIYGV